MKSISIKLSIAHLAVLDVSEMNPDTFIINRINVPKKFRGRGYGSKLLKEICEVADREKIKLMLEINPYGELTRKDLERWYHEYGFKVNSNLPGTYLRLPN